MAFKALNDTAGLNSLILTLFVFGIYLRIVDDDVPLLTIVQRTTAL